MKTIVVLKHTLRQQRRSRFTLTSLWVVLTCQRFISNLTSDRFLFLHVDTDRMIAKIGEISMGQLQINFVSWPSLSSK